MDNSWNFYLSWIWYPCVQHRIFSPTIDDLAPSKLETLDDPLKSLPVNQQITMSTYWRRLVDGGDLCKELTSLSPKFEHYYEPHPSPNAMWPPFSTLRWGLPATWLPDGVFSGIQCGVRSVTITWRSRSPSPPIGSIPWHVGIFYCALKW
jgi:hypothetical protein